MPRCPLPEAAAIKEPHARRTGGQGGCDRRTAGSAPVIDLSDGSELPSRPVRNMTSAQWEEFINALQPEQQQTLMAQMYKINAPLLLGQGTSEVTPQHVLVDLFDSDDFPVPIADPEAAAEIVIQRLIDAGFEIKA
jgi:hypothetical protein